MKWLLFIPAMLFIAMPIGCMSVGSIETIIEIQKKNEPIKVTIIYYDVSSDASSEDVVIRDFYDLVESWQSDMHLIERMEDKFYVKDRAVQIEAGKINAYETGIVRELDGINCFWYQHGEEEIASTILPPDTRIVMNLDEEEGFVVAETNGLVIGTGKDKKIVWAKNVDKLRVVIQATSGTEPSAKNRPQMIELLEKYIEKQKQNR
jgi:hypothetical protein